MALRLKKRVEGFGKSLKLEGFYRRVQNSLKIMEDLTDDKYKIQANEKILLKECTASLALKFNFTLEYT